MCCDVLCCAVRLYPIYSTFCSVLFCVGYYLATLEAATQHIVTLAEQFEDIDKADQLFNGDALTPGDEELY